MSWQIIGLSIQYRNKIELTGTVVLEPALYLVSSDFDKEKDFKVVNSPSWVWAANDTWLIFWYRIMNYEIEGDEMNGYNKHSYGRDRIVYILEGEGRGKLLSELEGKIFEQSWINSVTPKVLRLLRHELHLKCL